MKPSKVLTDSPQSQTTLQYPIPPKHLNPSPNSNSHFPTNLFYEPTSVLDPHLSSNPATATTGGGPDLAHLPWDSHNNQHHHLLHPPPQLPPSEEWDLTSWLLSDKDDLSPFLKAPHHPQFHLSEDDNPSNASLFDGPFDLFDPFDPVTPFNDTAVGVVPPSPAFDRTHLELLALLTPAIFHLLGPYPESSATLLHFIRRASPWVVMFVDTEWSCFIDGVGHPPSLRWIVGTDDGLGEATD